MHVLCFEKLVSKFGLCGTPFVMAVLGCQLHLELGRTQAAEHTVRVKSLKREDPLLVWTFGVEKYTFYLDLLR